MLQKIAHPQLCSMEAPYEKKVEIGWKSDESPQEDKGTTSRLGKANVERR